MNFGTKNLNFDIILYHGGCPDGVAAAWPFWRENNKIDHQAIYKGLRHVYELPNDIDFIDKRVIMVDYSLDREAMIKINRQAKEFVVLDHHESAERKLEGLDFCIFDKTRSGAQIAWDYAYGDKTRPWFIDAIADRDLWVWKMENSREYTKALYYGGWYEFDKLEKLFNQTEEECKEQKNVFYERGKFIQNLEDKEINNSIKKAVPCYFEGYLVKATVCPSHLRSDVGNKLAGNECHFAILWSFDHDTNEWWIAMRAPKNSTINLSRIAAKYGGGGHKGASGFAYSGKNGTIYNLCPPLRYQKISKTKKLWRYKYYQTNTTLFITNGNTVEYAPKH